MTIIHSFILGAIEGLTEFLPVSSTAHLIIAAKLLRLPQTEFLKFFEVFIQGGAILAVLAMYLGYMRKNFKIIINLLFSFVPTAVVGLVLYKIIKNVFFNSEGLIIFSLLIVGIFFLLLEKLIKDKKITLNKSTEKMDWKEAVTVGLVQSLAVIPGVSRSGIVMTGMMLKGYKREEAARYSFMLAVPTILAASGLDLLKTDKIVFSSFSNIMLVIIGTLVSFAVAYAVIKWFIGFLQKNNLIIFGIYRIVLALSLFFLLK